MPESIMPSPFIPNSLQDAPALIVSDFPAHCAMIQNKIKPKEIAFKITLDNPWDFFAHHIKKENSFAEEVAAWLFPLDSDQEGGRYPLTTGY
jgi:hypothetical protein